MPYRSLLSRPSPPVICTSTPRAVLASENGTTFTNEGITGAIEWDLPAAIAGMTYRFCRVDFADGEDVRIDPNGSEHIHLEDGTDIGSGNYRGNDIGVDAYYEITVECFKDGKWRVVNEKGTGETEGP